jgi:hypothetical protein
MADETFSHENVVAVGLDEVVETAMAHLSGRLVRRSVYDVKSEIVVAQKAAKIGDLKSKLDPDRKPATTGS